MPIGAPPPRANLPRAWALLSATTVAAATACQSSHTPTIPAPTPVACGVERWAVKTLSDEAASQVSLAEATPTTVADLNALPARCSGLPNTRISPDEFRVYEVTGRVREVRVELDHDYHVVLEDPADAGVTVVVEVVDPSCSGAASSPHRDVLARTRTRFEGMSEQGRLLRVRGIAFYDFAHRQAGRSESCLELHPVVGVGPG